MAGGRLILTDVSHHKRYYNELRQQFKTGEGHRVVRCERFGWPTLTIAPDKRRGKLLSAE